MDCTELLTDCFYKDKTSHASEQLYRWQGFAFHHWFLSGDCQPWVVLGTTGDPAENLILPPASKTQCVVVRVLGNWVPGLVSSWSPCCPSLSGWVRISTPSQRWDQGSVRREDFRRAHSTSQNWKSLWPAVTLIHTATSKMAVFSLIIGYKLWVQRGWGIWSYLAYGGEIWSRFL